MNDHTSQKTGRFVVTPAFDQTPAVPLPADNYLIAPDIIRLVKTMYLPPSEGSHTDWTMWYDWVGQTEAEIFFTPPNFPIQAIQQLGYPENDIEDIFQDENVSDNGF